MPVAVPCADERMNYFLRLFLLSLGCLFFGADTSLYGQQTREIPSRNPAANPIGSSLIPDTLDSGILPLDTPAMMTYVLIGNPDKKYTVLKPFI